MALLQRTRLLPNERLDLPDYNNIEDFVCADFKAINKNVWSNQNFVMSGFEASGTGTNTLSLVLANSEALVGADDGVLFIGAPSLPALTTTALTPSATSFVELSVTQDTGGSDSRAFWDSTAAGGVGAEFAQIVDTFTFLKATLNINTSNFTGDPDKVRLCEVDVNASGVITAIRDARNLYWRLGRSNDLTFSYPWNSRVEPPNTQFTGADKDIKNDKDWRDAVMSSIREVKGTTYWYEVSPLSPPIVFRNIGLSTISPISVSAKPRMAWNGSVLRYTDDNGTPSSTDPIAAIRLFDSTVVLRLMRQDGTGGSTTIPIGPDEVLWVEIPDPLLATDYSGVGVLASNFRVSARGSVPLADSTYWLAFREGTKLMVRGIGELQTGESSEIGDQVPQTLLDNLGLADEVTAPSYSSNIRGVASQSLVARIGVLTDAMSDAQEDRSGYLRSDNVISWTGSQITFTSNIVLELLNTKSGTLTQHNILTANSPISVANGESIWALINRTSASETITLFNSGITPIPAQTQANKDVFVLFRRVDVGGQHYLHIPFHKQVMNPGQSIRLGASGSGSSGIQKVRLHDAISTTLPTGPTVSIDGVAGVNGDLVLFSNLTLNDNEVYELSGVGVSIAWTPRSVFNDAVVPTRGDLVIVSAGNAFGDSIGEFNGTEWSFNNKTRFFTGVNYWELSGQQTKVINNNQVAADTIFSATASGSENWIVFFSILRGSTKDVGLLHITTDGTTATVAQAGGALGVTGVTFAATISLGNIVLSYTSTNTGSAGTMKYFTHRWSDASGGPSGVPSYSVNDSLSANSIQLVSSLQLGGAKFVVNQAVVSTTDATVTTLQTIAIPTDSMSLIEARIVGRRTGGSAGSPQDGATYILRARIKNVAGVVTINSLTSEESEDQLAWDGNMAVSGSNLLITVQGAVNNNVDWTTTTLKQQV